MKATLILSTIAGVAVAGTRPPPGCAFDNCFWKEKIPSEWRPVAKTFCEALVGKQPCNTKTVTTTQTLPPTTLIRTKPPTTIRQTTRSTTTVYDSIVETVSQIDGTSCVATGSAVSTTTEITFPTFTPASRLKERAFDTLDEDIEYQALTKRTNLPSFVSAGCNKSPPLDKLKAACKCFLQAPPPVVTGTIPSFPFPPSSHPSLTPPSNQKGPRPDGNLQPRSPYQNHHYHPPPPNHHPHNNQHHNRHPPNLHLDLNPPPPRHDFKLRRPTRNLHHVLHGPNLLHAASLPALPLPQRLPPNRSFRHRRHPLRRLRRSRTPQPEHPQRGFPPLRRDGHEHLRADGCRGPAERIHLRRDVFW